MGGSPEVWYMDCDGCLPDFYKQFRSAFMDPGSKLFVYEREPPHPGDGLNNTDVLGGSLAVLKIHWHAKYQEMEQDLRDTGWIAKQCNPAGLWGVWVWQRGGSRYTIHVWLLATWAALLYALSWLTDALAQRTPFSKWPVPIWRMLVLLLWRYLFENIFGVLPFNLPEPIIGLDCTWTCSQQNAFALSNFIFLYIAVLWHAVQVSSQPATMFLASIQTPFFLGLGYHLCWYRPESVCVHPGPLWRIWQATVMCTLALSSYDILGHSKLQAIPNADD